MKCAIFSNANAKFQAKWAKESTIWEGREWRDLRGGVRRKRNWASTRDENILWKKNKKTHRAFRMHDDFLVYEMFRMKWANSAPKWRHTASHYRSVYIGVYRTRYPILDTYTECSAMWKNWWVVSGRANEQVRERERLREKWRVEEMDTQKERALSIKWTKKCAAIALILLIRFLLFISLSISLSLPVFFSLLLLYSIALGWFYPPLVTLMHKHIL